MDGLTCNIICLKKAISVGSFWRVIATLCIKKKNWCCMTNNWNIPEWLEKEVRARDKVCVYCGVKFTSTKVFKKTAASWENIINDAKIITRENIALCCCGCNASKDAKKLSDWLQSKYCKERGINPDSVSVIIQKAILNGQ